MTDENCNANGMEAALLRRARSDLAAREWDRQINAIVACCPKYDLPDGHIAFPRADHVLLDRRRGITPIFSPIDDGPWPDDKPLVSVIIVSVDYGPFLSQAVKSVLDQTFEDIEIIVVDGGSTDETSTLAAAILTGPTIRVLFQSERRPPGANRNFGICQARGKYICCLDADDLLLPTYIARCVELIERGVCDVASSALEAFGGAEEKRAPPRMPDFKYLLTYNGTSVCAVFRRRDWLEVGGFRDASLSAGGCIHEDWLFWASLASRGARFFNIIDEPLIRYRIHAQSRTAKLRALPIETHRRIIREIYVPRIDAPSSGEPVAEKTGLSSAVILPVERSLTAWALTRATTAKQEHYQASRRARKKDSGFIAALACLWRRPRRFSRRRQIRIILSSDLFDAEWYRATYPDVAAAGVDPVHHYIDRGAAEGRAPGPHFDPDLYALAYPHTRNAGNNALVHYMTVGRRAGYVATHLHKPVPRATRSAILRSGLFNENWYFTHFLEGSKPSPNPLEHYLNIGGIAGMPAGPDFDSGRYMAQNPDVAESGLNPLMHYIMYGAMEQRPCPRVNNENLRAILTKEIDGFAQIEPEIMLGNYIEPKGWPRVLHFGEASPIARRWKELVEGLPPRAETIAFLRHAASDFTERLTPQLVILDHELANSRRRRADASLDNSINHADLSLDEQALLALLIGQALRPRMIIVRDSQPGWRAIALYLKSIVRTSSLHLVYSKRDHADLMRRSILSQAFPLISSVLVTDVETVDLLIRDLRLPESFEQKIHLLNCVGSTS